MEQRPLRLGDIVDDYCPRERRLTNHAIVAIVEQTIRQTRCTTCDAEHIYKDGRLPRRRKKDDGDATDLSGGQLVMPRASATEETAELEPQPAAVAADVPTPGVAAAAAPAAYGAAQAVAVAEEPESEPIEHERDRDIWPAHRPLIRATLPKPVDGEPVIPRPIPEFTMHQRPQGRGAGFRGYGWQGGGGGQGRNGGGPERNGNVMPGQGHGGGAGAGGGRQRRHRGRHKRPR